MVNLTKVAEEYLMKLKDGSRLYDSMDSWGLTANYDYWTGRHFTAGEKPIQPQVIDLKCVQDENKIVEIEKVNGCNETFIWNITHGMRSPFKLLVNVTVPMIRKEGAKHTIIFQLNLNNATLITRHAYNRTKAHQNATLKMVTKKCHFKADVTFTGFFAFHVKYARGDTPNYYGVKVTALADNEYLLSVRNGSLLYTVDGEYTQKLCRHEVDKRKRRSESPQ
ncbi:hypothetical protein V5799_019290 [Amblyomma americanum]|uniref:Uncharacterized protein n=1 Tax=Amblyomma americanum TaxID=6943 RepID=A0AAQ4EXU5_AMBAM